MKFIFGGIDLFGMKLGGVGIIYTSTWGAIGTYLITGIVCLLAIVGLVTICRVLLGGRRRKETPGERWKRTGRMS